LFDRHASIGAARGGLSAIFSDEPEIAHLGRKNGSSPAHNMIRRANVNASCGDESETPAGGAWRPQSHSGAVTLQSLNATRRAHHDGLAEARA
jgi:hypothetical protein